MWIWINWDTKNKHQVVNESSISHIKRIDEVLSTETVKENYKHENSRNRNRNVTDTKEDINEYTDMKYRYVITMNDGTVFTNCLILDYGEFDKIFKNYILQDERKLTSSTTKTINTEYDDY